MLIFTFLMLTSVAQALEPGQCRALYLTKKYISFPAADSVYPKSYSFKCEYECMNDEGQASSIVGETHVTLGQANPHGFMAIQRRNMEAEARRLVCQGVQVKEVSWGYDFDYVKPFYSHKTLIKSLKFWAKNNVSKNNKFEIEELNEAREIFTKSAVVYLTAGSSGPQFFYFQKAGVELMKIVNELPYSTKTLDAYLLRYKELKGVIPSPETSLGLVLSQIKSVLNWKLPIL